MCTFKACKKFTKLGKNLEKTSGNSENRKFNYFKN